MEKETIRVKIADLLDKKVRDLKESLKRAEDSVKQAPTAMESHSDTSRFQFGQLVDGLKALINQTERAVKEIQTKTTVTDRADLGSIVKIEKDGDRLYYYVSAMGLKEAFLIDGKELRVISINSAIAECLLGKKVGEHVEIKIINGNYSVKIIEIN